MNNKLIIMFVALLFARPIFSQTITTYYDQQWKPCKQSVATYYSISFVIQTDGKVDNVILDNKIDPKLDKYISEVLLFSPKWKPATHNNRIIPYQHIQSISLVLNPS